MYDPRGWEFEITVPNLLFILECSNSIKGKGLEGEFIYAWEGKDLVLLPCISENYRSSIEHTKLQSKNVSVKELKEGYSYLDKNGEELKVNDGNTFIQIYPTTGSISIKANETTQNAV